MKKIVISYDLELNNWIEMFEMYYASFGKGQKDKVFSPSIFLFLLLALMVYLQFRGGPKLQMVITLIVLAILAGGLIHYARKNYAKHTVRRQKDVMKKNQMLTRRTFTLDSRGLVDSGDGRDYQINWELMNGIILDDNYLVILNNKNKILGIGLGEMNLEEKGELRALINDSYGGEIVYL